MSFIVEHSRSIKFSLVWLAIIAVLTVGYYVYETERRFDEVSHVLGERVDHSSKSVKLLSKLSAEIGYGGFIHNFKNYVLRRDETYKTAAQKNYENIHSLVSQIEVLMADKRVVPAIKEVKRTVQEYFNHFTDLAPVLDTDRIAESDRKVKVDDRPAIAAINKLYTIVEELNAAAIAEAKIKQDKAHNFVMYGYLVVLVIFLTTSLLIVLIRKLESKTIQAESANRAKSRFLSTISHEIRTPLNGVLGLVQLINSNKFSAEEKYHLNLIQSSGELLLSILNDVLDLSKIEENQLTLENVAVNLNALLESTTDFYKNVASEKGLIVQYHSSFNDVKYVEGDPTKLRQILSNVLSNAIKFTDVGGVDVYAKCVPLESKKSEEKCQLELKIVDTGIGMTSDGLEKLFRKFTQADDSISRKYGGTGLGMKIAKELTELMGGKIEASSHYGVGTTFIMTIPFDVTHAPEQEEYRLGEADYADTFKDMKVLVAEDNMVNAVVAKGFLENMGVQVRIAHDGLEAVRMFENEVPDLILMDVNMPNKDGIQATREIRGMGKGTEVPILALTADAFLETREKCTDAGMNGVISKPFSFEALRNRIYDTLH